jgi:hypothetical protein
VFGLPVGLNTSGLDNYIALEPQILESAILMNILSVHFIYV